MYHVDLFPHYWIVTIILILLWYLGHIVGNRSPHTEAESGIFWLLTASEHSHRCRAQHLSVASSALMMCSLGTSPCYGACADCLCGWGLDRPWCRQEVCSVRQLDWLHMWETHPKVALIGTFWSKMTSLWLDSPVPGPFLFSLRSTLHTHEVTTKPDIKYWEYFKSFLHGHSCRQYISECDCVSIKLRLQKREVVRLDSLLIIF